MVRSGSEVSKFRQGGQYTALRTCGSGSKMTYHGRPLLSILVSGSRGFVQEVASYK